jgi:hypothetical protein
VLLAHGGSHRLIDAAFWRSIQIDCTSLELQETLLGLLTISSSHETNQIKMESLGAVNSQSFGICPYAR